MCKKNTFLYVCINFEDTICARSIQFYKYIYLYECVNFIRLPNKRCRPIRQYTHDKYSVLLQSGIVTGMLIGNTKRMRTYYRYLYLLLLITLYDPMYCIETG